MVVVAAYLLTLLWTVTASIAVAVIVSAVFAPFVLRLRDGGRSRTSAAAIVWATAILVIGGLLLLVTLAFLPYLADIVSRIDEGLTAVETQLADLGVPPEVSGAIGSAVQVVRDESGKTGGGDRGCCRGVRDHRHPRHVPDVLLPARR